MSKVVGDVAIKVGADTTSVVTGMRKAERSLANFAKVGSASAALVGAAMVALTKKSLAQIDVLAKQARSLGLTTDAYQKMAMVAEEAGVETGKLSASLGIMQRNIEEARKGTKTQTDAFKALGLSLSDLEGQTPDEQFEKLAAALDKIEDPARKTALSMDILGRGGRDMINMLSDYGAKAAEASAFQERFGIAVRQSASDGVERANDAVGRLSMVMQGLGNRMATFVAPAIEGAANAIISFAGSVMGARVSLEEFFGTLENAKDRLGEDVFNRIVGDPAKIADNADSLDQIANGLEIIRFQADSALPSMQAYANTLDNVGQSAAADVMRSFALELEAVTTGFQDGTVSGEDFRAKVESVEARARALVTEFGNIDNATFGGVMREIDALAGSIRSAAQAAFSLSQATAQMTTGTPLYEQEMPVGGWAVPNPSAVTTSVRPQLPSVDASFGSAPASRDGGGGGGGSNPMAARLESLIQGLKTEQEITQAWYEESLELLQNATEAELEAIGGKHAAIERLEQEHQERLSRIREMGNQWGVEAALKGGADILGAMGAMNKKAAKLQGVFSAAMALMSTYQGAATELQKGTLGFASAAAVIAKGIGFVSAIKSAASSGSGGGGGGGGYGAAASAPAQPVERRVAEFRFMGGNVLDPRAIVDAMNEAYDQGYQIRGVLA